MYYKYVFLVMCCFVNGAQALDPVDSIMPEAPINDSQKPGVDGLAVSSSTDSSAEKSNPASSQTVAGIFYYLSPCGRSKVYYEEYDLTKQISNGPLSPVRCP